MLTTSVVGSYTRPDWLISAMKIARGEKSTTNGSASLQELEEQAKLLTIKEQEDAGIDVITDGEQGRPNFYRYFAEAASGIKQRTNFFPENPSLIDKVEFRDARSFDSPLIVGELRWNGEPVTARDAKFLKNHTTRGVKMTIASPSLILMRMWRPTDAYPDYDSVKKDVIKFTKEEVDSLVSIGVDFIQLDSPELTTYADDSIPNDLAREEMRKAVEVINSVLPSSSTNVRTGVHVCWGNFRGTHRSDGFLSKIYPELLDLKADQLVLELASARHEEDIEVFKEYPSKRLEIGAGVIDVKTPDVDPVRIVKKRIQRLLKYIDKNKLWLNGDCGFASRFDTTLIPRSSCFQKLNSMSIAAKEVQN